MLLAVAVASMLGAVVGGQPVLRLGPADGRGGPNMVDFLADGRTVELRDYARPESRYYDLDRRADVPAPPAAPRETLADGGGGLFRLLGPKGDPLQTFFEPGFDPGAHGWWLSDDGKYLVTDTLDRRTVWRVADGKRAATGGGPSADLWMILGGELLTIRSHELRRTDLRTGTERLLKLPRNRNIGHWVATPDGRELAAAAEKEILRIDLAAHAVRTTAPAGGAGYGRSAFSADGKRFATLDADRRELLVVDYPGGGVRFRATFTLPERCCARDLAFTPAGDRVQLGTSGTATVLTFDAETGRELARQAFAPERKADPDGEALRLAAPVGPTQLLTVGTAGRVRLRDLMTRRVRETALPPGTYLAAEVTAHGKTLAVLTCPEGAPESRQLHLCDLTSPRLTWVSPPRSAATPPASR